MDTSVESPPGLEGISIHINGLSEELCIMGRIVDTEALLNTMPMSIKSSPGDKIEATEDIQVESEETSVKGDDGDKSSSQEVDFSEVIDSLAMGSDSDQPIDPEDPLFDPSKVEDDNISPIPVPRDNIR